MYQLTIATNQGVHTTCHADLDQAGRALLDYAIQADLYLLDSRPSADQPYGTTDLTAVTLLRLDSPAGRQPTCVGTASITATAPVAPHPTSLTGATAS